MPSGKTHDRLTWLTLPATTVLAQAISGDIVLSAAASLAHWFSGYYLSPDLDLRNTRPYQRWGILKGLWWPYQKFCKHRGFSHWPVIGTLSRVGWLLCWSFPALLVLSPLFAPKLALWLQLGFWLLFGLECGAATHYLADRLGKY